MPVSLEPRAGSATFIVMSKPIAAALLLVASPAMAQSDQIHWQMFVGGNAGAEWTIDATGKGEWVMNDARLPGGREVLPLTAKPSDYTWIAQKLAIYRPLAKGDAPCTIKPTDTFGFRVTWREAGKPVVATFTDSCGGIPTQFMEHMQPVSARIEALAGADGP
jgi:hypothetical protein